MTTDRLNASEMAKVTASVVGAVALYVGTLGGFLFGLAGTLGFLA